MQVYSKTVGAIIECWQLHAIHAYRQKKVSVYISEVSIFHVEEKMSLYAHVKGHLTKEGDLYTAQGVSHKCKVRSAAI